MTLWLRNRSVISNIAPKGLGSYCFFLVLFSVFTQLMYAELMYNRAEWNGAEVNKKILSHSGLETIMRKKLSWIAGQDVHACGP